MAILARPKTKAEQRPVISTFPTDLGWFSLAVYPNGKLARIWFGFPSRPWLLSRIESEFGEFEESTLACHRDPLSRRFQDYASGRAVDFSDLEVDLTGFTDFQRRVVRATRKIGYGQTLSYGDLAKRVGAAGAARAVGTVMANNRFPLVVPCHRVVASGGRIGGFSSIDGVDMKRRLLTLEGSINKKGALTRVSAPGVP